jgi:hypothetical protein
MIIKYLSSGDSTPLIPLWNVGVFSETNGSLVT